MEFLFDRGFGRSGTTPHERPPTMLLGLLRVLGVFLVLSLPLQATVYFTVNSDRDEGDTNLLDGACIASGGGCTLRAAIEQANASPGVEEIIITIQVPRITVAFPSEGYVILRDNVHVIGGSPLPGCGDLLPVKLFPGSGGVGAVIERVGPSQTPDEAVAFTIRARQVRIERVEIRGFATGVEMGPTPEAEASLVCLDVHEVDTGISVQSGSVGLIASSAVHASREAGISVAGGADVRIRKNCIGTALDCETPDGNGYGLQVASPALIEENVIAANDIGISSGGIQESPEVRILNNVIGTDWSGSRAVGNRVGISHWSSFQTYGAEIAGNVISGNAEVGLQCSRCRISLNRIGTDATGRSALPNGIGVRVVSGGLLTGSVSDNLISGNDSTGVVMVCGLSPDGVKGNIVGMDITGKVPLGNGAHGIHVPYCEESEGTSWTMPIGGGLPDQGNVIAHNGGDGIRLGMGSATAPGVWAVQIAGNRIHHNGGSGIVYAGGTPQIAAPQILSVRTAGTAVQVAASMAASPGASYTLEFFANTEPDPSGFGEGQAPIGTGLIETNQFGFGEITVEIPADRFPEGAWVTATATGAAQGSPNPHEPWRETSSFSNAMRLLAAGRPSIRVEPTDFLFFGDVSLGDQREIAVEIVNTGEEVLSGAVTPGPNFEDNDFTIVSGSGAFSLPAGGSREVKVRMKPVTEGDKRSLFEISHNVGGQDSPIKITVTGKGVPSQQSFLATSSALRFGSVTVGAWKDLAFLITNGAGGVLNGEVTAGSEFRSEGYVFVAGEGPYSLQSGQSHEVVVRLKPGSTGIKPSSVRVTHDAGNVPSPFIVTLEGEGMAADVQMTVSRERLDFGPVAIGTTAIQSFVVYHAGGTERLIGSVVDGTSDFPDLGFFYERGGGLFNLGPGDSLLVQVGFSPRDTAAVFTRSRVAHNATNAPWYLALDVTASGYYPDPEPVLATDVDTLAFGQVPLGFRHTREVLVSNVGSAPLEFAPTLVSGEGTPFMLETAGIPQSVPPGGTLLLSLSMMPLEMGTFTGTLLLDHNAAGPDGPVQIPLRGTGIAEGTLGAPELIEPANGHLGVESPVSFRWNPVATATSYVIEVSAGSDFETPVLQQVTTNTGVVDVAIATSTPHIWRVMARRGDQQTPSDTWRFVTARLNRPPVARNDTIMTVAEWRVYIEPLMNDTDPDGDEIRITAVREKAKNGTVLINPTYLLYLPDEGFRGDDWFVYEITDSGGLRSSAQVFVTVGEMTESEDPGLLPIETRLEPNYPNPFSSTTRVPFTLAQGGMVRMALYDLLGRRVQVVFDGSLPAGAHEIVISGADLPSGAYFCLMETREGRWTRHLALVR